MTRVPDLTGPLRRHADGLLCLQAGTELIISHAHWLHRDDFTTTFISRDDGPPPGHAWVDWRRATTALDTGDLPASSSETRILRLAASLADGVPVDLRDTLTSLDARNINLVTTAILHASGQRPATP